MKCTVAQPDLSVALQTALRAVAGHPTLEALGCVLLEATEDGLKVTGTDLSLTVNVVASAKVERPGKIAVQARLLSSFVDTLVPGDCILEVKPAPVTDEGAAGPPRALLTVTAGAHRSNIHGLPASEYPPLEPEGHEAICSVPPGVLQQMVAQVQAAVSSDETSPRSGILVDAKESRLRLVATDGNRLAMRTLALAEPLAGETWVVIPAKHLRTVAQCLRRPGADVEIWVSASHNAIGFSQERLEMASRLLDGNFPQRYEGIFPKESLATAVLNREELQAAVRTAAVLADGKGEALRLEVGPECLTVRTVASEVGDDEAPLPAQTDGEPVQTAFNPRFLLDALQQVTTERVQLALNADNKPTVFTPVGRDDFATVMMPIRTAK
jgi:DNA polymerase-3 subunit beta